MHNHSQDISNDLPEAPAVTPDVRLSRSLAAMNAKLAGKKGKVYWKTFEELSETAEFQQFLDDEIPNRASLLMVDRRKFLTLGGAAFALAGLSGCRFLPQMKAVPYVRNPDEMVPGRPMTFTSTLTRAGYGFGVLVESHEGRPTKIEGNPNHPASLGSTDVWAQAEILGLYDPDRAQSVKTNDETSDLDTFLAALHDILKNEAAGGGAGIAFLTETITSPTLAGQRAAFLKKYPNAAWYEYEAATRDNIYRGTKLALGRPLSPIYHFDKARVIVSLDSDFLLTDGNNSNVRYARDFADGRRVMLDTVGATPTAPTMSRLYAFDTGYTITGASADHRIPVRPSQVDGIARALYSAVSGGAGAAPDGVDVRVFAAIVKDLISSKGAAVVVPGDHVSPAVHAVAHAINALLAGTGKDAAVTYVAPLEVDPGNQVAGLKKLVDAIDAGKVKTLFLLGGNPVYDAPADYALDKAIIKVPNRIRLSRYEDETAQYSTWLIPESHALEAWGDARAFDGTTSIVQPLIAPLYATLSASEFLAHLLDEPQPGYDILHAHWAPAMIQSAGGAEVAWETALVKGVIEGTALPLITATPVAGLEAALPAAATPGKPGSGQVELILRTDTTLYDGRYANNSWLQETPKPVTTITWDNAAHISPNTAVALNLVSDKVSENDTNHVGDANGKQLVTLEVGGAKLTLPVWILPGVPDGTVTVHLGFGRTAAGNVGNDQGANAYVLRTSGAMGGAVATIKKADGDYQISSTQAYHSLRGINEDRNRDVILAGTLDEFIKKNGKIAEDEDVVYTTPAVRAFPDAGTDQNITNPDGSLGQNPNMDGSLAANAPTIDADEFRKEWKYTDVASSNDKGWNTIYPEFSNKGFNAWGMGIDLTTCIGCNACSIACQAENNVPTVGKDQVGRGRHMHWIRIDHYYAGPDLDNVESYFQPLACVQCEKAPCEPVCPVAATIHSHEGINQMVYNRCIGTRYCSNNCPYKVRRFNFLKWTAGIGGPTTVNYDLPVLKMLANPEVTVRGRGVMEKCNYCIQRINVARIDAKKEERGIRDGEVVVACQQACPTRAIVFGDISDPNSAVSKWRKQPHDYSLLSDLNTRPRTTYLARIRNVNPDIAPAATGHETVSGVKPAA